MKVKLRAKSVPGGACLACKKFASVAGTQGRLQKICKRRWHSGKAAKNLQASLAPREGCKKFASVPDTQGRLQKICKRP